MVFRFGVNNWGSSIVSRWDGHSDKGEAPAGKTSYAWIWTKWGEQVAFYCDYD
ncbi:lactococcin 972 family bacteriocin [Streptococcus pneumoniae]|nr:lactococcin 972 family bacteriocin [Streptococcus pneumoniae]